MATLKISAKTSFGAKTIGNLPKHPDHWIILREAEEVSWSDKSGPWYFVYPDIPQGREYNMCVNRDDDRDFKVELT